MNLVDRTDRWCIGAVPSSTFHTNVGYNRFFKIQSFDFCSLSVDVLKNKWWNHPCIASLKKSITKDFFDQSKGFVKIDGSGYGNTIQTVEDGQTGRWFETGHRLAICGCHLKTDPPFTACLNQRKSVMKKKKGSVMRFSRHNRPLFFQNRPLFLFKIRPPVKGGR